jgi:hypothetical protein
VDASVAGHYINMHSFRTHSTALSVMHLLRRSTFWRSCRRKVSACVVLVAYLVAASGLSVPAAMAQECAPVDAAKPQCGCCAAARAGQQCCCCRQPTVEADDGPPVKSCCAPPKLPKRGWALLGTAPCQRATTAWITTGDACPGPRSIVWCPYLQPTDRISSVDTSIQPFQLAPPDPPPRLHEV